VSIKDACDVTVQFSSFYSPLSADGGIRLPPVVPLMSGSIKDACDVTVQVTDICSLLFCREISPILL